MSHRTTSTDYARRPPLLRVYNHFTKPFHHAPLDPDALLAAARARAAGDDFGDPAFQAPLRRLVESINREARLTPFGRAVMAGRLRALLENRLRIEACYRAHPEIAEQPLRRPIVIAGLQRTGTTLLHRLLAADPAARALLSWEALRPAPLPGEGERGGHKRRREARLAELGLRAVAPDFFAIHPVEADAPEEDVLLLDHAFTSQAPEATLHVPAYAAWLEAQDLVPSYRYLARALRLLSWQRGGHHWVLKTPHHLEYLRELLAVFPDALIVQTHRDPQATMGSFCSMVTHARLLFSEEVDPREVGRHWLRKVRRMLDRAQAARDGGAAVIDVSYYDLVRDAPAQVRRIYDAAGLALTPAAEAAMRAALRRERQHRHGRHAYRARDFGLSPAAIEQTFADYRARFAIPREAEPGEAPRAADGGGRALRGPVTATLSGVLGRVTARRDGLRPIGPDQRLDGVTALVTGASSGLGQAVAVDLLRRGARLILPLRGGVPQAGDEIARRSGVADAGAVQMLPVDLSDLDSVLALSRALEARREAIDLYIGNAGLMPARGRPSPQGLDVMFVVHYLANHLLLRRLLRGGIIRSGAAARRPRVVLVSSEAHRACPGLDLDRLGSFVPYGVSDGFAHYARSKLALCTFAVELSRRLPAEGDPGVHALCPGAVNTRIAREAPALLRPVLAPLMRVGFRDPAQAAAPVLYLAAAPELAGDSGWYLHLLQRKAPSPAAQDPERGRRLWQRGEELLQPWLDAR